MPLVIKVVLHLLQDASSSFDNPLMCSPKSCCKTQCKLTKCILHKLAQNQYNRFMWIMVGLRQRHLVVRVKHHHAQGVNLAVTNGHRYQSRVSDDLDLERLTAHNLGLDELLFTCTNGCMGVITSCHQISFISAAVPGQQPRPCHPPT